MDLVTEMVVPGFLGGLVIALFFIKLRRRGQTRPSEEAFEGGGLSTDVINISKIRVAGIGGVGLVAMAVVVALNVPRIGQSLALGLGLGLGLAAALILMRRSRGPMPSSGRHGGANTVLSIDDRPPSADQTDQGSSKERTRIVSGLPGRSPHVA